MVNVFLKRHPVTILPLLPVPLILVSGDAERGPLFTLGDRFVWERLKGLSDLGILRFRLPDCFLGVKTQHGIIQNDLVVISEA